MTNTKPITWHRISDPDDDNPGTWIKWSTLEVGTEIEGVWLGTKPGKRYGDYGVIKAADGRPVCFALPLLLAKRLAVVAKAAS